MKIPLKLALGGLGCLVLSLLLPAIRIPMSMAGSPLTFHGWEASVSAMEMLWHGSARDVKFLVLGLCVVLNVLFVLVPAALMRGAGRILLSWLGFLAALGAVLSAFSQFAVDGAHPLAGYYTWLAGYVLICCSLIHALRRPPGIEPAAQAPS